MKTGDSKRASSGYGKTFLFVGVMTVGIFWLVSKIDIPAITTNAPAAAPPAAPAKTAADLLGEKILPQACALLSAMREPDSVEWISIAASADAATICFDYRARNGFGGMNRDRSVLKNGRLLTSATAWSNNCAKKPLQDMTWEKANLRPGICGDFTK
jgi:hypothetical protein